MKRLELLAETSGLDRGEPMMRIMQQVDVLADLRTKLREQVRHVTQIFLGRPDVLDRQPLVGRLVEQLVGGDAIGTGKSGDSALRADREIALIDIAAYFLDG